MIIGIDGNEANVESRVGIGEYSFELLKKFKEFQISHSQSSVQANFKFQIYLKSEPRDDMPMETGNWKYIIVKPSRLWTQIGLPLYLYSHSPKPNVFFTPTHYAPRFSPVPTVISIMDLSYIYFPELFAKNDLYQLTHWTSYSAKNARKIFTISESSKSDIMSVYHVKKEDIVVTYPGIKPLLSKTTLPMDQLQKKFNIPKKYILFVGTIQPRKNIGRLIEAFEKIQEKNKDVDLVIVGKKGWLYEPIFKLPRDIKIEHRVHFLEFVSEADLGMLYENALCFILPSLYEGFGLPVLEAMQHGCPVITSNVSSLPEAGGDACLYIDPTDAHDIAKKISLLIENKKLREELVKKGYTHLKKFSWEKAAKQTLAVLEEVASQ